MSTKRIFALFPLPKVVAIPGHRLQFHIFEPRYRKMIQDCVELGMPLGVPLAIPRERGGLQKPGPQRSQSLHELLHSNQESYQPHAVFGAGPVKVLKTLDDGRLVIEIAVEERVRISRVLQDVPYLRVEGEVLPSMHGAPRIEAELVSEIAAYSRLLLGSRFNSLGTTDGAAEGERLSRLIYETLRWLILDPADNQKLLAEDDVVTRAHLLLERLREVNNAMQGDAPLSLHEPGDPTLVGVAPPELPKGNTDDSGLKEEELSAGAPTPPMAGGRRAVKREGNLIVPDFRNR